MFRRSPGCCGADLELYVILGTVAKRGGRHATRPCLPLSWRAAGLFSGTAPGSCVLSDDARKANQNTRASCGPTKGYEPRTLRHPCGSASLCSLPQSVQSPFEQRRRMPQNVPTHSEHSFYENWVDQAAPVQQSRPRRQISSCQVSRRKSPDPCACQSTAEPVVRFNHQHRPSVIRVCAICQLPSGTLA